MVCKYVGMFYDTDRTMFQQNVDHSSLYDSLTKLPSFMLFFDRLLFSVNRALRIKERLSVLVINLSFTMEISQNMDRFMALADDVIVNGLQNCV